MKLTLTLILLFTFSWASAQINNQCNGVRCLDSQYCHNDTICVDKKNLDEKCPKEGTCGPTYSECIEDICTCVGNYVNSGTNQCVPKCDTDSNCRLGSLYCNSIVGGCLPKVNLKEQCTLPFNDKQCSVENALCSGSPEVCSCDGPNYVEDGNNCIKSCVSDVGDPNDCGESSFCNLATGLCRPKAGLGGTCSDSDDNQCLTPNAICEGATCSCPDSFVNYYNSACLKNCKMDSTACNTDTEYCNSNFEVCFPKANLHQSCDPSSEDQCLPENTDCLSGAGDRFTCQCKSDHSEENGQCIARCETMGCSSPYSFCNVDSGLCESRRGLGEQCSSEDADGNSQCIEGLECKNAPTPRCSCPGGKIEDNFQCIDACVDNSFCSENEYCFKTTGRCIVKAELNGWCDLAGADQCKTQQSICQGGLCKCMPDYVETQDGGVCKAKCKSNANCESSEFCGATGLCHTKLNLGDLCDQSGSGQCRDENGECTQGKCSCKSGFGSKNNLCVPQCSSSTSCGENEYCDTDNTKVCWNKAYLNENCIYSDQCRNLGAVCQGPVDDKKCSCNLDFVEQSNNCFKRCTATTGCNDNTYCDVVGGLCARKKPLGQRCESGNQCVTTSTCDEGTCKCDGNSYAEGTTKCIKKCTVEPSACDPFAQYCEDNGRCFPKVNLHQICFNSNQCKNLTSCEQESSRSKCKCVAFSEESAGKCDCMQGYIEKSDVKNCLKIAPQLQEECEEVQQCTNIGEGIPQAICHQGKCQCPSGDVDSGNLQKCLKIASQLEDDCEEHQQCTNIGQGIPDAACTAQKCGCKAGNVVNNAKNNCLKEATQVNDACTEPQQCFSLGSSGSTTCSNFGRCVCNSGFVNSTDIKRCLRIASNIGDNCVDNTQCVAIGVGNLDAICNNNGVCSCNSGMEASADKMTCQKVNKPSSGNIMALQLTLFVIAVFSIFCF